MNKRRSYPQDRLPSPPPHVVCDLVYEGDPDGRPVTHHRTVDTLGMMLRAGTITQPMHDAARDFLATFTIAGLETLRSLSLLRIPGAGRASDLTDTQIDARHRLSAALDALGGGDSPAGSCAWHVVGRQCSIREWALRQGWGGRPIPEKQAQGILVAALGVLVQHYGYGLRNVRSRARSMA